MNKSNLAWRGFVAQDLTVIAWPTYIAEHNRFHNIFHTEDSEFIARWRQWGAGDKVDFDGSPSEEAKEAVRRFLEDG